MRRARALADRTGLADDAGSAPLEFIAVGLLMLVPLVYLVVALGQLQERALGVQTASRQLARVIATADDADEAAAQADAVAAAIAEEYGMPDGRLDVELECAAPATGCPQAGAVLTVVARSELTLPLVPALFDGALAVPVEASSSIRVSRFWAAP